MSKLTSEVVSCAKFYVEFVMQEVGSTMWDVGSG